MKIGYFKQELYEITLQKLYEKIVKNKMNIDEHVISNTFYILAIAHSVGIVEMNNKMHAELLNRVS